MQLFISFLISLNFLSVSSLSAQRYVTPEKDATVVIELRNANQLNFDFSMTYEENRKIIKIRSGEPVKSLRTVERATNSHKGYNVMGSDLIILPQHDFSPGSYIMELKFQNTSVVLLADMHVVENPVVSGN